MTGLEALKKICLAHEKELGKQKVACPFRSISNEYCEEYEEIKKSLKALEIIERELVIEYLYNFLEEKYDLVIYDKRGFGKLVSQISKEEGDILKKVL